MDCDRCRRPAIVYQRYSGMHLCSRHFQEDFERKAKRAIRKNSWIRPGDRIGIALSGGVHSTALVYFLGSFLSKRQDIDLIALTIDEGIGHYQDSARARNIAQSLGISWYMASFREIFGVTMDEIVRRQGGRGSCSRCRVLRTQCLTMLAREHRVTRIALGLDLDDGAGSVLMNILRGEPGRLIRMPVPDDTLVPCMMPFMNIPEREVALYAWLYQSAAAPGRCPYFHDALGADVATLIHEYSYHHPATRYALVHLGENLKVYEDHSGCGDENCQEYGDPVVETCMNCRIPGGFHHGF
jgi:tRNA(Ile)-lysidine synthase TilS/MesJ